jgi:preprotein translocase subunit SecE
LKSVLARGEEGLTWRTQRRWCKEDVMLDRWKKFLREVRSEINKVTWPKRREVRGTTIVVLITCVVFGVYLWFVDIVMGRVLTWLYAAIG